MFSPSTLRYANMSDTDKLAHARIQIAAIDGATDIKSALYWKSEAFVLAARIADRERRAMLALTQNVCSN